MYKFSLVLKLYRTTFSIEILKSLFHKILENTSEAKIMSRSEIGPGDFVFAREAEGGVEFPARVASVGETHIAVVWDWGRIYPEVWLPRSQVRRYDRSQPRAATLGGVHSQNGGVNNHEGIERGDEEEQAPTVDVAGVDNIDNDGGAGENPGNEDVAEGDEGTPDTAAVEVDAENIRRHQIRAAYRAGRRRRRRLAIEALPPRGHRWLLQVGGRRMFTLMLD